MLPRGLFEFVDKGTEDQLAVRRNREQFEAIRLKQRVVRDVSGRGTASELFGKPIAMPVAIAPTGIAGLLHYRGELALARAAAEAGIPFTLATGSLTSIETIAEEAGGELWFQLYAHPDKAIAHAMVERVRSAGFQALVVTVDNPVVANREHNLRNGFTMPFRVSSKNAVDILCHPRWLATVIGRYWMTTGLPKFENFAPGTTQRLTAAPVGRTMPRTDTMTWESIDEYRKIWPRTLILKGILNPEDAVSAVEHGADAIVVSNHGGRIFDSAVDPLDVLPEIVSAVGGRAPVIVDSGVMRGSDVVKALCLGASATLVGRATLWGIAVGGEEGATRVLELLKEEITRVLGQIGCPTIAGLNQGYIHRPGERGRGLPGPGASPGRCPERTGDQFPALVPEQ